MLSDKIILLRGLQDIAERTSPEVLVRNYGAKLRFVGGAYELRLSGIVGTATAGERAAVESWLRAVRRKIAHAEAACAGHVANADDAKICGRCGVHIDDFRPDDDPINLAGSGPVPIEPREG